LDNLGRRRYYDVHSYHIRHIHSFYDVLLTYVTHPHTFYSFWFLYVHNVSNTRPLIFSIHNKI
jgi:hypothetical protein